MSKYINADEFTATIRKSTSPSGAEWIVAKVNEMPSADVVEVVRCKDCKYHLFSGRCDNDYISRQIEHCGCYPDFNTPDDFFCKYGERKETE